MIVFRSLTFSSLRYDLRSFISTFEGDEMIVVMTKIMIFRLFFVTSVGCPFPFVVNKIRERVQMSMRRAVKNVCIYPKTNSFNCVRGGANPFTPPLVIK